MSYIDIVFDGPPGPTAGRFVEVENAEGRSINAGEWLQRADGYWVLRIKQTQPVASRGDSEPPSSTGGRTDLLSCPFCGAGAKYVFTNLQLSKWRHRITCSSMTCGMDGPCEATKADACAAWNRRSLLSSDTGGRTEEVREAALEKIHQWLILQPSITAKDGIALIKDVRAALLSLGEGGGEK